MYDRKRRTSKDKTVKGAVEIYAYVDAKVRYMGTGIYVLPGEWDKKIKG